ncbi:hypothetical protein CR513_30386, partial [Mucuna pruriens]
MAYRTLLGIKENSNCKNWINSTWKPKRTLESISKLHSRLNGPFVITNDFPYVVVNRHQIKLFHEGPTPIAGDMETISLMESAPNEMIKAMFLRSPEPNRPT